MEEEEEDSTPYDAKLLMRPCVSIEKLDLFQHLDYLSSDCLTDLTDKLRQKVLDSKKETPVSVPTASTENDNDDIQVIKVKLTPKTKKSKIEIQRSAKRESQVLKLRKKGRLSRNIFKDTLKRITSNTAVIAAKEVTKKVGQAMDIVSEKLSSLKEREKKLFEMFKKRTPVMEDASVKEELDSMVKSEPSFTFSYPKQKVAIPSLKYEKIPSKKPETTLLRIDETAIKNLQLPAKTLEEKYHILDARDKLLQSKREITDEQKLIGTCPDMCPEKERIRRCYQLQLSPFEMINYPTNTSAREDWIVKEYARSSADQDTPLPHDLRPLSVLNRTMDHLCRNIADFCEYSDDLVEDWYVFMWDRTRAIRKDLTHQDTCSTKAVQLIEQCARFHIHCAERLVDQDVAVYDDKINTENLTKCLQTLKYLYNDLRKMNVHCPNAAEFLAYKLLLNLNNPSILTEVRDMPDDIIASKPIRFALDLITATNTRNYIRFFQLVKNTNYLNACLARRYFSQMRIHAFSTIVLSHCPKRQNSTSIPILPLVDSLMFESVADCKLHLHLCNLQVGNRDGTNIVILDRKRFTPPETTFPTLRSFLYIQEKKQQPLSEIIWGGSLEKTIKPEPVHNSFNSSDIYMVDDSFLASLTKTKSSNAVPKKIQEADVGGIDRTKGQGKIFTVDDDDDDEVEEGEVREEEQDYVDGENEQDMPLFSSFQKPSNPVSSNHFSFGNVFERNQQVDNKPTTSSIFFGGKDEKQVFSNPIFSGGSIKIFGEHAEPDSVFQPVVSTVFNLEDRRNLDTEESKEDISKNNLLEYENKMREKMEHQKNELLRKEKEAEQLRLEGEKLRKEQLEKERIKRERKIELEEKMRKIEKKRKEEEKTKQEQKKRQEEKLRKEKQIAKEKAHMVAENARRSKISKKLQTLKEKYVMWKVGVFARKWRKKTWEAIENRKMDKYLEKLALNYPPVCNPELLNGNPIGVIIPNTLQVRRRPTRHLLSNPRLSGMGPPPILPLVHMGRAVAPSLQTRVNALYPDPTSPFRSCFPWKLVLCLPDVMETQVRLDTFIEMHFVQRFDWKFGIEQGQLASCIHKIGTLELVISVRRVKGLEMFEGDTPNPSALLGANSILFFLTDYVNSLPVAKQRLEKIRSFPGGEEVPIVAFVFGNRLSEDLIRNTLNLKSGSRVVMCCGASQQSLVSTLSQGLSLAADISGPVPSVYAITISSLLKGRVFDQTWRRVEHAFHNFNLELKNPEPLIKYWNQCCDNLITLLTDSKLDMKGAVAPEFITILNKLESPLVLLKLPKRDKAYRNKLNDVINDIKLPPWPKGAIKNTQDLNFKLHKYGKTITKGDKNSLKHLKWRVYRVIQKTLLWKGLDIYCDDDINVILRRFPWARAFQELTSVAIELIKTDDKGELAVVCDKHEIDNICYLTPLIQNLAQVSNNTSQQYDNYQPKPENDSVLLAYAKAVEREIEAEKERNLRKPKLSEQVSELLETTLPFLEQHTMEEEENSTNKSLNTSGLKRGYSELDNMLSDLTKKLEKRRRLLEDILTDG